jgi:AcrR family transcriptional regulator
MHLARDGWPGYSYKRMKQSAPDTTPVALLLAARRLFADHGFDGASVRAITNAAETNLGAITYHFGSKRRLYEAVMERAITPLANAVVSAAELPGPPAARVAAVVRAYFEVLTDDPDIPSLMMQDLVIGKASPVPAVASVPPLRRVVATLSRLVEEGQASGEFRAGEPRLMAVSMIALPVHMNLVRRPLKAFGFDLDDAQTRERLIQHVIAFAYAGLANRTES